MSGPPNRDPPALAKQFNPWMSYLFLRLSVIRPIQRFNSVLIHESFVSADEEPDL